MSVRVQRRTIALTLTALLPLCIIGLGLGRTLVLAFLLAADVLVWNAIASSRRRWTERRLPAPVRKAPVRKAPAREATAPLRQSARFASAPSRPSVIVLRVGESAGATFWR